MSTIPTNRESDRFMLRLPDGMRARIKAAAESNNRSMNAEIVAALEDWLFRISKAEDEADSLRKTAAAMIAQRDAVEARLDEILARLKAIEGAAVDYRA